MESLSLLPSLPPLTLGLWVWHVGGAKKQESLRTENYFCGRSEVKHLLLVEKFCLINFVVFQSTLSPVHAVTTTLGQKGRSQIPREMTTRLITGESSAFIKKVSSGDMFYACLTGLKTCSSMYCTLTSSPSVLSDKGILMTFGNGVNGCLGHGNYDDASEVSTYICLTYRCLVQ